VTKSDSFALDQKRYVLRHNPREKPLLSLSMDEGRFLHLDLTGKQKQLTGLIAVLVFIYVPFVASMFSSTKKCFLSFPNSIVRQQNAYDKP
jgi:hypothetical protein